MTVGRKDGPTAGDREFDQVKVLHYETSRSQLFEQLHRHFQIRRRKSFGKLLIDSKEGMPHPTTGSPDYDSTAYTRVGNTINAVRFKTGRRQRSTRWSLFPARPLQVQPKASMWTVGHIIFAHARPGRIDGHALHSRPCCHRDRSTPDR